MRFSIIVTGHPEQGDSSQSAWRFCCAVLRKQHHILQVFFLHDASYQAFADNELSQAWCELSRQYKFDISICITAMEKRFFSEEDLQDGFSANGLGQLVDATIQADRTITFR